MIWRKATVIIIPKPGKPDYGILKEYRPVSLLSCLRTTLEKIMARRMPCLAEKNNLCVIPRP